MFVEPPPDVTFAVTFTYAPWVEWRVECTQNQREQIAGSNYVTEIYEHACDQSNPTLSSRRAAMEAVVDTDASHVLMLQDDLDLCQNFIEATRNAVQAVPNRIVQLLSPWEEATEIYDGGCRWLRREGHPWGPALVMPTEMVRDFLDWVDIFMDGFDKDDDCIGCWNCLETPYDIWVAVPGLVEHLGAFENIAGESRTHGHRDRDAELYVDEMDVESVDIDWSFGSADAVPVQRRQVRTECLEYIEELGNLPG